MGQKNGSNAVTSFLITRLPSSFMNEGFASFSFFACSHGTPGSRVALSLESPFYETSILEVGICGDNLIHAANIASDKAASSTKRITYNTWTHAAVVWDTINSTFSLFVDGQRVANVVLNKASEIAFVKSAQDWRLVLGRGKSSGITCNGWDGEVGGNKILVYHRSP